MNIYYSASTGGFYDSSIHGGRIPADAVEITVQEHAALMAGQSAGKKITPDENGRPVLQEAPPLTTEEVVAAKIAVVQTYMDSQARLLRYDDIKTACTYADEPAVPRFQAEGRAFREWRSTAWAMCHLILEEVTTGGRAIPSDDELIAELPALQLPV